MILRQLLRFLTHNIKLSNFNNDRKFDWNRKINTNRYRKKNYFLKKIYMSHLKFLSYKFLLYSATSLYQEETKVAVRYVSIGPKPRAIVAANSIKLRKLVLFLRSVEASENYSLRLARSRRSVNLDPLSLERDCNCEDGSSGMVWCGSLDLVQTCTRG